MYKKLYLRDEVLTHYKYMYMKCFQLRSTIPDFNIHYGI